MGACARNMQSDSAEIKPAQCCIKLVFHLTYTMMQGSTKLKFIIRLHVTSSVQQRDNFSFTFYFRIFSNDVTGTTAYSLKEHIHSILRCWCKSFRLTQQTCCDYVFKMVRIKLASYHTYVDTKGKVQLQPTRSLGDRSR